MYLKITPEYALPFISKSIEQIMVKITLPREF
jgi:hypothetical protein